MVDSWYFGMDINVEHTQLCYYCEELNEPESLFQDGYPDTYLLPNAVFYGYETKQWYYSHEAMTRRLQEDGFFVEQLLQKTNSMERVQIEGQWLTYDEIYQKFLIWHLESAILRRKANQVQQLKEEEATGEQETTEEMDMGQAIARLVLTVYRYDKHLFDLLYGIKEHFHLSDDSFCIIGHTNSYLHYVFEQPESIRNNSVGLFDYHKEGMEYYRIDIQRKQVPMVVKVIHKSYQDRMGYYRIYDHKTELDMKFLEIVREVTHESYLSAVYMTGVGFSDEWARQSLNELCAGRRVFLGQNLFSKGACYAARSGTNVIDPSRYMVESEDMVLYDVGLLTGNSVTSFVPIALGGREWYNMKGKRIIFLDNTNRIELLYRNRYQNEAMREIVEIQGLPNRPNKTTKLSLEVEMSQGDKGAVVIRDEGFGDLYPTTNKIYRKEFTIEKE